MLGAVTLLLVCQLAGEAIQVATGVPVPGPVIGMALLFAGLVLRRRLRVGRREEPETPGALAETAQGLLNHLSLLFVPAGVGVMLYLPLVAEEWLAISVSLVASTVITIVLTAALMAWLARRSGASDAGPGNDTEPK
ncbi:MAG: CidA/LrgA family protein [Rhodospirillales bacterium]|nr:MAG: CidA/LrgA family protein [Rhodospirillales bacterium]